MEIKPLKLIVEAILLAAGRPLTLDQMLAMFEDKERPERAELREAIKALQEDYSERGIDLVQVGGGFRVKAFKPRLWYGRLGYVYNDYEFGDANGLYAAVGYDFYLDRKQQWSIAPEFMVQYLDIDVAGRNNDVVAGSLGVYLTYHWKARREK